jgi:hypothetical protein
MFGGRVASKRKSGHIECMMSILGEVGLSEDYKIRDNQNVIHVDKFVLLVLESARVEIALL